MSWEDEAACKGQPREWFTHGDSPVRELRLVVAEFCVGCPVRATCMETASYSDEFWTVRGRLPKAYAESAGEIDPNGRIPIYYQGVCLSGRHAIMSKDDIMIDSRGSKRCRACRWEEQRRARIKRDSMGE